MGAGPSRRLTFLREGDGIMITEDAIRRIAQDPATATDDVDMRSQPYESHGHMPGHHEDLGRAVGDMRRRMEAMDETLKEAYEQGVRQGSLQLTREKDHELRMRDIAWQKKLDETLIKREDEGTAEFSKTVAELSTKFKFRKPRLHCQAEQGALKDCYRQNPGRSLNCNDTLQAFADCAARARQDYLARQV